MRIKMKKANRLSFITGLLLTNALLSISPIQANSIDDSDEDDYFDMSLEELLQVKVVTVASGVAQTIAQAPSVVSVITAEEIEAMGATDLDEVLETIPGLHVARASVGYNPLYILRGIYSSGNQQVLLMINDVPIKTLESGNRSNAWGGMPISSIAKIEVIRGPGSAVFGADAFSGVINITTKDKSDIDGTEIGTRVGSFNTRDAWVLHGDTYQGIDAALMLEYHSTDGQKEVIETDAQTAFDQLFGTSASLAPGSVNLERKDLDARMDLSYEKWQLRAGYQQRRNQGNGAGVAQALDPSGQYDDDRINADLTYHDEKFTQNWDVTAKLDYYQKVFEASRDVILFPPGAFGGAYPDGYIGNTGVSERRARFNLYGLYDGFEKHLIRMGIGYDYGEIYEVWHIGNFGINPSTGQEIDPTGDLIDLTGTPYAFLPTGNRKDSYIFAQDTWNITDTWIFTGGIRYDKYSDFGSTTNPRLALNWQPYSDFNTKLMYGQAFRSPGFNELNSVNNPTGLGNPNLTPEKMKSWELAFDYRYSETLHGALNLFTYKWSDAILYLPDSANEGTYRAKNAGIQKGHGIEFELQWKPDSDIDIIGNYAWQHSTDENNQHDAGNAPHHQFYLRGNWRFLPDWQANLQLNRVGKRERVFGDPRDPVDGYTMVDLAIKNKLYKNSLIFTFAVHNLFDTKAYEPSLGPDTSGIIGIPNDLPLSGRSYFLEIQYKF